MNRYAAMHAVELPNEVMVLEELCDREGVLVLTLSATKGDRIRVTFDDYAAYRKADEGDMLATLSEIGATSSLGSTLYEVDVSDYISWFVQQSRGARSKSGLRHFAVLSLDDIVDVISPTPPSVFRA